MHTAARLSTVMVVAAVCFHAAARPAAATTLHVATTGSDFSIDCSAAAPCRTINHAVDLAGQGDTIQVGAGTFSEDFGIHVNKILDIVGTGWLGTRVQLGWYVSGPSCCAVFNIEGEAIVTLSGMTISGGRGTFAGGISNQATLTLQNVRVADNISDASSGGAISNGGFLTMYNVAVSHNRAYFGLINFGTAWIYDSRITDTFGTGAGSHGVGNGGGTLTMNRGLIASNQGTGLAIWNPMPGGLEDTCPETNVTNVTISHNSGGGITAKAGATCGGHEVMLTHVTVAANTAKTGSGGLHVDYTTVNLRNSLLADNSGPQCGLSISSPANVTAVGSMISDLSCNVQSATASLIGEDPLLGPLQWGVTGLAAKVLLLGPTKVHKLKSLSPAIDGGWPAYCAPTDQLGTLRTIDGNGDGVARCDMGAYEYRGKSRGYIDQ